MIQAIGLTSTPLRNRPPVVDDLTFEVPSGQITGLLGAPGAGKSTTLRLMLALEPGRGVTLFEGRPLHRVPRPARAVGVLLGDVPGHPARSARNHLRMLCSAFGVSVNRADEVLDVVGLTGVADQRLASFSLSMDRRLGLAVALLAEPRALLLDEPARDLAPRDCAWVHALLRSYVAQGGAVLITGRDAKAMARTADRIVTIDDGRLIADQPAEEFARTRLRPHVAVHSPHAQRLAVLLADEGTETLADSGNRIVVYGSSTARIGETAYRHGILLHRLADEEADTGLGTPLARADGHPASQAATTATPDEPHTAAPRPAAIAASSTPPAPAPAPAPTTATIPATATIPTTGRPSADSAAESAPGDTMAVAGPQSDNPVDGVASSGSMPEAAVRTTPLSPARVRPLRYELRRMWGVGTPWWIAAASLLVSVAGSLLMAGGEASSLRLLSGWPVALPLPPAALGAGLLGALSYGQEFRYPVLVPGRAPVPRWPALLAAKLAAGACAASVLAALAIAIDLAVLRLLAPGPVVSAAAGHVPVAALAASAALAAGCAWAGVLAACVFRTTALGMSAVLAVPLLVAPVVRAVAERPVVHRLVEAADVLRSLVGGWPGELDGGSRALAYLAVQPIGCAMVLSIMTLLCLYLAAVLRGRAR